MIPLRDRIDILAPDETDWATDVAAHVSMRRTVAGDGYDTSFWISEQLIVTLPPDIVIPEPTGPNPYLVRWRGENYKISEPPKWHRRHGIDHHQTIGLERFA